MAYNPYTPTQINDFIKSKGIENDPWAMYNFRQQYNVDPAALDTARGWGAGTSQGFMDQAQKTLAGPIAGTRELDTTNPHMAYALAQHRGNTAGQADTMFDMGAGTSAGWAQSQGLTGFGAPPAAGGASPPASSSATPNPYLAGSATSSTATPNPYMPAGGQTSNYGNDPRVGGPSQWGQQGGMQGLSRYLSENPHMLAMGGEMTRQVNNNLQRQVLPGIRRGATANGTLGGSRQGVAEGLAIGESMSGLAGALAKLYGDQFNQDRGYGLQSDALDFGIHRGNLQDMRQGQMDQLGFLDQMSKWGQQGIGAATQVQNTPLTRWQQFSDTGARLGGLGSQQSQQLQGNPWLGAAGGWLAGSKMFGG